MLQGVANRDIKLENTLLDGSPRPLIKVHLKPGSKWAALQQSVGSCGSLGACRH
jgi:hypothetical protein